MKTSYRCLILVLCLHVACCRYLDMTHNFNNESAAWPFGQKKFTMEIYQRGVTRLGQADLSWFEANNIQTGEHVGTHIDAPCHYAKGAWRLHEIPIERLIAPAVRIDIRDKASRDRDVMITRDDIIQWEAENGDVPKDAVVFQCSGWGDKYGVDKAGYWGNDKEDESDFHFPAFGLDAAKYLVETRKIAGIGVDTPSVDPGPSLDLPVHIYITPKNIFAIEHAKDTCKLPARGATVYVFPIKTENGSGGPLRLVASWSDDPNGAPRIFEVTLCLYLLIPIANIFLF